MGPLGVAASQLQQQPGGHGCLLSGADILWGHWACRLEWAWLARPVIFITAVLCDSTRPSWGTQELQ